MDGSRDVLDQFTAIMDSLGLACDAAPSAQAALGLMEQNAYDLAFLDWRTPGVDGIELARRLRGSAGAVLMISAFDWPEIEFQALSAGINRYISKPLFASPIIDCINDCLSGHSQQAVQSEPDPGLFLGRRLLLVEDVAINREVVKAMLEETRIEIGRRKTDKSRAARSRRIRRIST